MKLADTPDLGSGAPRRGGSSPLIRTIFFKSISNLQKLDFHLILLNLFIQNLAKILFIK